MLRALFCLGGPEVRLRVAERAAEVAAAARRAFPSAELSYLWAAAANEGLGAWLEAAATQGGAAAGGAPPPRAAQLLRCAGLLAGMALEGCAGGGSRQGEGQQGGGGAARDAVGDVLVEVSWQLRSLATRRAGVCLRRLSRPRPREHSGTTVRVQVVVEAAW
jgi:hypothetical protein